MFNVKGTRNRLTRAAPRIFKAVIQGFIWFVLLYMIPTSIFSIGGVPVDLFPDYTRLTGVFTAIVVFFVVAAELCSKTVFQHAFNIAKVIVLMVFFVYALNGGFVRVNYESIHIVVDLRVYLAMLLTINFLGLAKSALQTLNFLFEKTEDSQPLKPE